MVQYKFIGTFILNDGTYCSVINTSTISYVGLSNMVYPAGKKTNKQEIMKKKTVNILTTILGVIFLLSILPVVFIIAENLMVIIPLLAIIGVLLIYCKNEDAIALLGNALSKFKK